MTIKKKTNKITLEYEDYNYLVIEESEENNKEISLWVDEKGFTFQKKDYQKIIDAILEIVNVKI